MQIISKSELQQALKSKEDLLLIDTLSQEHYQQQHIPSAINIPAKDNPDFAEEVAQRASKDQRIVVYCANSQCPLSKEAARKLEQAGFTNVAAFEEGVEGWFGTTGQAAA